MNGARDIAIRRCTLRVTRRGGWSWGAESQVLTRAALDRLPALLESWLQRFGGSLPDGHEIMEQVKVTVRLDAKEWREFISGEELSTPTLQHMRSAVDAVLGPAPGASPELAAAASASTPEVADAAAMSAQSPTALEATSSHTSLPGAALAALLNEWQDCGQLAVRLSALPEAVLELWAARLLRSRATSVAVRLPSPEEAAALRRQAEATVLHMQGGRARQLVRTVLFLQKLTREFLLAEGDALAILRDCWQESCEPLTTPTSRTPRAAASAESGIAANEEHGLVAGAPPTLLVPARISASAGSEVDVSCALPFLMLGPLSRSGYLTALAAVIDAARAGEWARGFALGLARKALNPPLRGWRRSDEEWAAAAAFAGLHECKEELIFGAGRVLRPQLPVLNGSVASNLIQGHRASAAWLLVGGAEGQLLLVDEDGVAPCAAAPITTLASLVAPTSSLVFVDSEAATDANLDVLDDLQIPYACAASLAHRASVVSFVSRHHGRLWTSAHGCQRGRARALAERGADLCAEALANWRAILEERPALRPGADPAFESALAFAASFALGTIAWTLWHKRERPSPQAALARFADLDARVRIDASTVRVKLPLGGRSWDLRDHGLLADVRGVPWLDGRTVTFGMG